MAGEPFSATTFDNTGLNFARWRMRRDSSREQHPWSLPRVTVVERKSRESPFLPFHQNFTLYDCETSFSRKCRYCGRPLYDTIASQTIAAKSRFLCSFIVVNTLPSPPPSLSFLLPFSEPITFRAGFLRFTTINVRLCAVFTWLAFSYTIENWCKSQPKKVSRRIKFP